jgi:hypothetical protein
MEFLITGMNRKASFGNIPQQAAGYYIPAYAGYPYVLCTRDNLIYQFQCTTFLKLESH